MRSGPRTRGLRSVRRPKVSSNGRASSFAELWARRGAGLTGKHRGIAQFVLNNPQFSSLASTRQLAQKLGVDATTVMRFARALGFSGFTHFQQELRHSYLGLLDPPELIKRQPADPKNVYRAAALRDLRNLHTWLETLDVGILDQLADRLLAARRIMVIATGSYAAPAFVLAHLCSAFDLPVDVEIRGRVYWVSHLARMSSRDLVVGISFWQCDRDTVDAIGWAAKRGVPTAAITDSSLSPLAERTDLRVIVPTEGMLFFQSVTVSLSLVYGLVARMWSRLPAARRDVYDRIRHAFRDLEVFVR